MKATLIVTQEDIDESLPYLNTIHSRCRTCPLAKAFSRFFGIECRVFPAWITSIDTPTKVSIETTDEMRAYMRRADRGHLIEPQSFDFECPDELMPVTANT